MVTSKQFYHELRSVLAPLMKGAGFKNAKGGRLGWTRPSGSEHLFVWFQCNKWGWSEAWGSTFTVEFQTAPAGSGAMTLEGRFERIGYLLEGFEELDELRKKNNTIIERLPGTPGNQAETGAKGDRMEFVAAGFVVDDKPAVYGRDVWMNYYSTDDVREWARYFEKNLLYCIALFEDQKRSPQGLARERFHEMMGRVQAAKELREKILILESYVRIEADEHYRSAAEHWLVEAGKKAPSEP